MECLHRFCRECIDKSMRMGYVILVCDSSFLRLEPFVCVCVCVCGSISILISHLLFSRFILLEKNWIAKDWVCGSSPFSFTSCPVIHYSD